MNNITTLEQAAATAAAEAESGKEYVPTRRVFVLNALQSCEKIYEMKKECLKILVGLITLFCVLMFGFLSYNGKCNDANSNVTDVNSLMHLFNMSISTLQSVMKNN